MKTIFKLLIVAGALLIAERVVSGIEIANFWPSAVCAALALGILNSLVRPIIKLFALPITIITLGLFSLVLNVLIFWLITFVPGVTISSFSAAFWGLLIVMVARWIADIIIKEKK